MTNSFLNLHIWKFKRSNISGTEYKPTEIPFEKYNSLGWLSEFYTTLLYLSDIGANSFAQFRLGASNSVKDKYLKKRKNAFWNQYEIVQYEIREDENFRGIANRKKVIIKDYYLKFQVKEPSSIIFSNIWILPKYLLISFWQT